MCDFVLRTTLLVFFCDLPTDLTMYQVELCNAITMSLLAGLCVSILRNEECTKVGGNMRPLSSEFIGSQVEEGRYNASYVEKIIMMLDKKRRTLVGHRVEIIAIASWTIISHWNPINGDGEP